MALAVSRERIGEMAKSKEKEPSDKRNLYLAREGLIRANTQAAAGVSTTDMNKRMKVRLLLTWLLPRPSTSVAPPLALPLH